MSHRDLPARANLDHLKHEAKALLKAYHDGDGTARTRVHDVIREGEPVKLTHVQRVLAREYGFPSWARLRTHVQASRGEREAIDAFLAAVQNQDAGAAKQILDDHPRVARESLHVAAALGRVADVSRLAAAHPELVRARAGNPPADPLLYLCYSPFHGESPERDTGLLESARALLAAGADPNTRDARYGVPALFAVTGMRSILPLAKLLLAAGANPTDGESIFHAAEHFHQDALELLLSAGADLNYVGEWGNTAPYFLLRWFDLANQPNARRGFMWLLDHGADPNITSGEERETCLHVAARRGQDVAIVRTLLDHGARVNERRADGRTAWYLAARNGFDTVADLLAEAGAETKTLSRADMLVAACGRGDVDSARRLSSPELIRQLDETDRRMLPEAAADRRDGTVLACVAAGFPIDARDDNDSTALHFAALRGRAAIVRALLAAGARHDLRDKEHSSTPLAWALWGSDFDAAPEADYPATVRALVQAGARRRDDEYMSRRADVRAALDAATERRSS